MAKKKFKRIAERLKYEKWLNSNSDNLKRKLNAEVINHGKSSISRLENDIPREISFIREDNQWKYLKYPRVPLQYKDRRLQIKMVGLLKETKNPYNYI